MMRLFHSPTSPFVRKCVVLLHETGLMDQVELVAATGTPLEPNTMPVAQNPLGKIPALQREAGPTLYDSRVICQYLNTQAEADYYPAPRLWEVLTLEATADGILEAALSMRYEGMLRPEEHRMDAWVEAQWTKIDRTLRALESRWTSHLAGPVDMGHIAVGCALGYLDLRHDVRNWRASAPSLATWYERFAERPSMQATAPDPD